MVAMCIVEGVISYGADTAHVTCCVTSLLNEDWPEGKVINHYSVIASTIPLLAGWSAKLRACLTNMVHYSCHRMLQLHQYDLLEE